MSDGRRVVVRPWGQIELTDEMERAFAEYPQARRDAEASPGSGTCVECGHRGLCDYCYAENLR